MLDMLLQYLICIDAMLRSRNSTVSVKLSVWLHKTQISRDANIKESRLFMYILNNSDILFSDSGRFLCVNAYFGVTNYHLILFIVTTHSKQETW